MSLQASKHVSPGWRRRYTSIIYADIVSNCNANNNAVWGVSGRDNLNLKMISVPHFFELIVDFEVGETEILKV